MVLITNKSVNFRTLKEEIVPVNKVIEARFRPTDLYISATSVLNLSSVPMALGKYLFPSRTQKSSPAAAIILPKAGN